MFVNKVELSGKAWDEAERHNGPFRFTICQGGGLKKDSQERWPKEFFNVVAWPNTCAGAEQITKGVFVAVTGRLKHVEYTDKENNKRRTYEILADSIEVSKTDRKAPEQEQKPLTPTLNYHGVNITDDDIPF